MLCHEPAVEGIGTAAVALCRFCSVGLCEAHRVEGYRSSIQPTFACSGLARLASS